MKPILFILVIFFLIECKNQPIVILQFYPYNKMTDTSYSNNQVRTLREDYFLISNFKGYNNSILYVDSFVGKHINPSLLQYNTYRMYFFKESRYTNLIKIEQNPRELDRYSASHDLVFQYTWIDGKFTGREKIKNGETIDPEQKKLQFTIEKVSADSIKK